MTKPLILLQYSHQLTSKCQDKPYANTFFLNFTFPSACQQSCRNFLHLETLMPCSPIQKPVLLNKKIVMHH